MTQRQGHDDDVNRNVHQAAADGDLASIRRIITHDPSTLEMTDTEGMRHLLIDRLIKHNVIIFQSEFT